MIAGTDPDQGIDSRTTRFGIPARLAAAWLAAAAFALACGSAATSSSGAASTGPTAPTGEATGGATQHVSAGAAGFEIPAGWHARPGAINPSGNWTVLFVGPQDLPAECTVGAEGGVCHHWPVARLSAGGTVIAWRVHGMPGSLPPESGDAILVGGRPARIVHRPADPECAAIGGDMSVAVAMAPRVDEPGWAGIDACQAGPDHGPAEAEFERLLASVTWASS